MFFSRIVKDELEKIGLKNVVRIVTDSASNMKAVFSQFKFTGETEDEDSDSEIGELGEEEISFLDNVESGVDQLIIETDDFELAEQFEWSDLKHICCSAHRLQLVLKDAIGKNKSCQELKKVEIFNF